MTSKNEPTLSIEPEMAARVAKKLDEEELLAATLVFIWTTNYRNLSELKILLEAEIKNRERRPY